MRGELISRTGFGLITERTRTEGSEANTIAEQTRVVKPAWVEGVLGNSGGRGRAKVCDA